MRTKSTHIWKQKVKRKNKLKKKLQKGREKKRPKVKFSSTYNEYVKLKFNNNAAVKIYLFYIN